MAAMTAIALGSMAIAGTSAIASGIEKGQAKRAIDNFEWQNEPTNPYKNLAPSTAGAELRTDNITRQAATLTESASDMGARGLAYSGKIAESETQSLGEIASFLDQQYKEYDKMVAQGDLYVQQEQNRRDQIYLQSLGQQYQQADTNMWQGIGGAVQTAGTLAMSDPSLFKSTPATEWANPNAGQSLQKKPSLFVDNLNYNDLSKTAFQTNNLDLENQFFPDGSSKL